MYYLIVWDWSKQKSVIEEENIKITDKNGALVKAGHKYYSVKVLEIHGMFSNFFSFLN